MVGYFNGIYISLIILSMNVLSYSYDWNSNFTAATVVCTSEICNDYAKYVAKSMNRNADPCTDFYEFVCGLKKNPYSHYYPAWSTVIEMMMRSSKDIRNILEEEPKAQESSMLKKAKNLYKACIELPSLGVISPSVASNYIQDSGYFPLFFESKSSSPKRKSWVDIHSYYSSLTGDAGLYDIFPTGYHSNNYEPMLHLTDVYSPFGKVVFKNLMKGCKQDMYEKYLKAILFSVFSYSLLKVYPKVLTTRIHSIVKFRCEIRAIQNLYPRFFSGPHQYNIMTVGELESWYDMLAATERTATIPWVELIYLMYNKSKSEEEIKRMPISVVNKSYHQSLMHLIHKTPNDVIVNHMHFYFLEKHLETSPLVHDILIKTILFNGKLTGTVMYPGKKWHSCILSNPLKETIGKAYVQRYFPSEKKRKIQDYVAEFKDVLRLQIQDSKWLDGYLMNKFGHIVDDMKAVVGYPEYYDSEHLRDGNNLLVDPGNVEAFYCAKINCLIISAASFQQPLYDLNLPKTILYGSIGVLISHELQHAFGPKAIAECYSITVPPSKKFLYDERVNCFLKKYNKLPVKELRFLKPTPIIDGLRTLEENIADAMGLKLAYEAFRKDAWENDQCSIIPIHRGLTCEQLFFIAFGTIFCSNSEADMMLEEVMEEEHSTPRIRVNEAVANMREFSKAFDCPKRAAMNPVDKCDLWK